MRKARSLTRDGYSQLRAETIVRLLDEPTEDRRPLKRRLQRSARVKDLVEALRISKNDLTRRILCDILGARRARTAIPVLIECLSVPSAKLQGDAAEALGKIGSQKAGEALLQHFIDDPGVDLAGALGGIGYRPAIPHLISALADPSMMVRGGAAWALGELRATEALQALEKALESEPEVNSYASRRMNEALERLSQGLARTDPGE